jgi:large subunit ribosomal protein L13
MKAELQKTTLLNAETAERDWYIADASEKILGRFATQIAVVLMGKHKPSYTNNVDSGDFVIVLNAAEIAVSGEKSETKEYDSYSYYPGGRRVQKYATVLEEKPEFIVMQAVKRMLPKNKLGRKMLTKLKVYAGGKHDHAAQQPKTLDIN